jgi:ubiquinone/menaquinone biosynthesis C-methylase UbiE
MFFKKNNSFSEKFYRQKITQIFDEKKLILDIGGGLRVSKKKGNRFDPQNSWLLPLIEKADYKILDPVSDYHPDIVGDIHNLPFDTESVDAIICNAVLEHVENPIQACNEMYRVLKKGGYAFWYVPFLYYYHAEEGYYKDYWRFTIDALNLLSSKFSSREFCAVRGRFETWLWLSPFGKNFFLRSVAQKIDLLQNKKSQQVSGYNLFLVK